jgi:hypothetical protein
MDLSNLSFEVCHLSLFNYLVSPLPSLLLPTLLVAPLGYPLAWVMTNKPDHSL